MAKLKTREKILKAAEELFSKNGYDGVPTKLIAKEAGVTEMTLFNHFKNKALLYHTVVKERFLETDFESMTNEVAFEDLETDLGKISEKIIQYFFMNKNILLMRLKERDNFMDDPRFKLEHDPMFEHIIPFFEKYNENGVISKLGQDAAMLFIASLKGILYVSFIEDKSTEFINRLVGDFVETFCNGIKAEKKIN